MRLLKRSVSGDYELQSFKDEDVPPYAILSHTWSEGQEVTYAELVAGTGKEKTGHTKIKFCDRQAAADGLQHFWVDTCCIDKSDSQELSSSINSMFRWYQRAAKCYVYLSDVAVSDEDDVALQATWKMEFRRSRWFTRGWTLQELLAPQPSSVEFFSKEGKLLGSRTSLEQTIHEITNLPVEVLRGQSMTERSVEERLNWVGKRETTVAEDKVYCLLGIFGVFLPLIYGEGEAYATVRLKEEIHKRKEGLKVSEAAEGSEALFNVPFARDNVFVGREDIIARLEARRTNVSNHTRMALVGLGGVGKSQIAIEYAYRVREKSPDLLVMWIHASEPTRFRQGCRGIANKLLLPGREEPNTDVVQLVHAWLSDQRNGQWLMILDNVDDDGVFFGEDQGCKPLESYLPQTKHGTILITSRNNAAATNLVGGLGDVVQVEPMNKNDALALLSTRVTVDESHRADAEMLVDILEGIPLAITHAAAYIKTRASTTTITSYIELFRESETNQVHLLSRTEWKDIRRDHSIRYAVIATWQISFQHIQKAESSAADLLALMSMYHKQGVPCWLLQRTTGQLDFEDALAPLLSFSLVRLEIGAQALTMHRLVQLSMRRWLVAEKRLKEWTKESIRVLSGVFPSGEYGTWEDCQVLLPHAKEVLGHTTVDSDGAVNQSMIAFGAGWYLRHSGDLLAAEKLLRLSLEIDEKVLGEGHPNTLASINNLGVLLKEQGRYDEAEAMHQRGLDGCERVLGPEHPHTLTSIGQLGIVLGMQGKYDEAEAMHQRGLEGCERVHGPEHPHTLTSIGQLGIVLGMQGKYDEAEAMHQRGLDGCERVLGPEHPHTLTSIGQLGIVLGMQGKYDEAEVMHRRGLEGQERLLGLEHPETLNSVNNLAVVLRRQRKYREAEVMHQRGLEGKEKVLGQNHPETLTSVYNLAVLFHRQRQFSTANELYHRAYNGRIKVLGAHHPETVLCLSRYRLALEHKEFPD